MNKNKRSGYYGFTEEQSEYFEQLNKEYDNSLSPYACKNEDAIYRKPVKDNSPFRTAFNRDADSIVYSEIFRCYGNHANPLYFHRSNDILKRSFHTCLVSKISREIGRVLKLNCDLIETIALALDLGHAPFGQKGEEYLSDCRFAHTGKYFHHNVQSARIFRSVYNCNVSLQVLSGILCHNGNLTYKAYEPSPLKSFKEFDQQLERCYSDNDYQKSIHPNTLEGCVVRISDMIAQVADYNLVVYHSQSVPDRTYSFDAIPSYKNKDFINHLMINLVKNSMKKPYLRFDKEVFRNMTALIGERNVAFDMNEELNAPYETVIKPLMYGLYERLLHDVKSMNRESPIFDYMKNKVQGRGYFDCDPMLKIQSDPNDVVTDYIASMTDDSFIELCKYLHINDKLTASIGLKS